MDSTTEDASAEGQEGLLDKKPNVNQKLNGLTLLLHLTHQVQHTADVQGAKDQVHIRGALQDFPAGALGNTATDADEHVRALPLETF